MNEGQELVEKPATGLSVFNEFELDLIAFEAADAEKVFDTSTPEGYAACKTYHALLRKVYNGTDKLRKKNNEDARKAIASNDKEGNAILARVDAMANPRKAQYEAEDAKVKKEIDRIAAIAEAKAKLEKDEILAYIDNQAFDNAKLAADLKAQQDELTKQKADLETAKRLEATKAKAKKDAEEKAAQDAKDLAEKVEQNKKDAAEKAAKDKQDAIDKIESDRIAKELEEKTKQDELDEAERKKKANKQHKANVEAEALTVISRIVEMRDDSLETSILLLAQIIDGAIPHVELKY